MFDYFQEKKVLLTEYLHNFYNDLKTEYSSVNEFGPDVIEKLEKFVSSGKMIRGGLVFLGAAIAGRENTSACIPLGVAMELFQSAFLIHDDIMDRDVLRRSNPSIYFQFVEEQKVSGVDDYYHLGESLGMCTGDVAIFQAFELIGALDSTGNAKSLLLKLISRELSFVGIAQMQDVSAGNVASPSKYDEILRLYTFKTGRYTFSLPLICGAILADADTQLQRTLNDLGISLGILFQLKDDELGLFSDSEDIGKSALSDVSENKKTLYHHLLFKYADTAEKKKLGDIFGQERINETMKKVLFELLDKYQIRDQVRLVQEEYAQRAQQHIDDLGQIDENSRQLLIALVEYNQSRGF